MNDRTDGTKTRRYGFAGLPGVADGSGGEEFDPRRPLKSFAGVAARIMLAPRAFFAGLEPHGAATYALLFALSCSVVSHALEGAAGRALAAALAGPGAIPVRTGFSGPLVGVALSLAGLFVSALVVHVFARALLAPELGFGAVLRVACYASATELVAWVPIVGPLTIFYWIFLMVLGMLVLNASALAEEEDNA